MTVATLRQVTGNFQASALSRVVAADEPVNIGSKLKAWWDASVGVTIDGSGMVQTWLDRVSAVALTQATAGLRPAYVANAFAGGPAIRGDGVDDYLECVVPGAFPLGAAEGWIWLVFQGNDVDANLHTLFGYGSSNPSTGRRSIRRTGTDFPNIYCGASLIENAHKVAFTHVMGARFAAGGATIDGYFDGDAIAPAAAAFSTGGTRVRAFASVDNAIANYSAVGLKHILVTDALTSDDISRLGTWGQWQAGILVE